MSYITAKEKRKLIQLFIENYKTKKKEVNWILKYLIHGDEKIERIKIVDNIENCPIGLVIYTSEDSTKEPMTMYFNDEKVIDVDSIAAKIRQSEGDIYLDLRFPKRHQHTDFLKALEDNPNNPWKNQSYDEFTEATDELIKKSKRIHNENQLKREIDKALSKKDKEKFLSLTNELNKIKQ